MYASGVKVELADNESPEAILDDPKALRALCQAEAAAFSEYLRSCGITIYKEGLVQWEQDAVAGYLYQKLKGRIDGQETDGKDVSGRREDGEESSQPGNV
jgi:hypothetical protein